MKSAFGMPRILGQYGAGFAVGSGAATLAFMNASLATRTARLVDPNNRKETKVEQGELDAYAAGAALLTTHRVMTTVGNNIAYRVGLSTPASAAVGLGVSWGYQNAGPTIRNIVSLIRSSVP